jgi:hypothetical protein
MKRFMILASLLPLIVSFVSSAQAAPINIADYPSRCEVIDGDTMKMRKILVGSKHYWVTFDWVSGYNAWRVRDYGLDRLPLSGSTLVVSAERVGQYSSLALASDGTSKISYYDVTNANLIYADWKGNYWLLETVDPTGNVGQYTSLALDAEDCPHISYYDASEQDLNYAMGFSILLM